MRERITIIVNPASGRGKGSRRAGDVAERLREMGCRVAIEETSGAGDAARLASGVCGAAAIVVVGGDGTVNEVVRGLPESGAPPIAMIPTGTANVMAKELGLPRDPGGLAEVIARGREIPWDLAVDRVGDRKFLLLASAGYDAHVVHVFHAARRGTIRMWQYVAWGLQCLLGYHVPRIRVEADGQVLAEDASWVHVTNVAAYGGPLRFTPQARPDDGLLEVRILRGGGIWKIVGAMAGAFFRNLGLNIAPSGVTFHRVRKVRLESAESVPVQLDGEPGGHLPVEFEALPGAIRVLAPATE